MLGRALEDELGVADDVLIERQTGGDKDRKRGGTRAPGTTNLLPQAGNAAGVAAEQRRLQIANVDAEFERVGGGHGAHLAAAQPCFDGAPLGGHIAATIAAHGALHVQPRVVQALAQVGEQQFGGQPRAAEDDALHVAAHSARANCLCLEDGAAAQAKLQVINGRVVEDDLLLAARRAVAGNAVHLLLEQRLGQLAWVGNRGAGANELRLAAIVGANALQAAQHVGYVAAKNAPVGVDFVHHHKAQPLEERRPLRVRRQYARVEHVRVGEDDARAVANARAFARGRVAIVDRHRLRFRQRSGNVLHPTAQTGKLILRQRFGGEEVECTCRGVAQQRLEDGQVVGERLAAGGGRHNHHVAPRAGMVQRLVLVAVERGNLSPR